ncbi:MarR family winged helix-turn-helix transcriptional regulator [Cohnella fermenti]|uniref:MarR family transcriptional regulator n=1 Tax=Cohnella fermenti TaxID=2565925 RepID=A0A4S4BKJ3_9BACL|nr:MarR family transcriptional regulator [Cohnella fermenti]THF75145.1 MarR family transcriptional regulator [Cohnella fermenti]
MTNSEWSRLEEIDWLFRRVVRRFVKERDKISIEGIALPGMLILQKVLRDGEQKLRDLAEELDLTSGAITALCDKLEEKGFAVRRRMSEDRRTVLLSITDDGRALLARNRDIGPLCIELLFGGLTVQELETQRTAFLRIADRLERFSDIVLERARKNERRIERDDDRQTESPPQPNKFLNY